MSSAFTLRSAPASVVTFRRHHHKPPAVPEAQRRKVRNQGQHQTGNDTGSLTTEVSGSRSISSRNDTLLRLHRLAHVKLWTALYVPAIGKIGIFSGMHRVQEYFSSKLPIKNGTILIISWELYLDNELKLGTWKRTDQLDPQDLFLRGTAHYNDMAGR